MKMMMDQVQAAYEDQEEAGAAVAEGMVDACSTVTGHTLLPLFSLSALKRQAGCGLLIANRKSSQSAFYRKGSTVISHDTGTNLTPVPVFIVLALYLLYAFVVAPVHRVVAHVMFRVRFPSVRARPACLQPP